MSDERIEKLGTYFVYFDIRQRYGITFERFVNIVSKGGWHEYVRQSF
ncbi:hypothetical protein UFOVP451_33 [uncultured Caudovirales phage]|uniref:Uncharacterized protein n=1 Tax=uncultured Caudovirales phage TaxID=2100421 RepID=A0A6J5M6I1_9CAUD|nr:hypothetical protein UFOVP451_33 [uncultured Caudovirales phage]